MNLPELILAIVLVVMVTRVMRDRHRGQANAPLPVNDDMRIMAEEIARLRERVQVLERVVTDGHQTLDLDREIDRLRDR
ncbi:MAG: hypothetical protein ACRYFW_10245 [Janthinobacterium lividum]